MIRQNGNRPLTQLRHEVDRLFGDFFREPAMAARALSGVRQYPAVNVWEKEDNLYAEAELPGMKIEELEITVVGNELSIKGKRGSEDSAGVSFHRQERRTSDFDRVLRLPVEIDADQVQATLRDGVLLITLPKAAAARPRKIQVKAGE